MDELLKLTQENNILLKQNHNLLNEIYKLLDDMNSGDTKIRERAINFGIGICSNIVGDRLLGL